MTQNTLLAIAYSIAAGLFIELFFRLIKYRDGLNREGPRGITAYGVISDASNYLSVAQYLSGGERRWLNYFLFRLLPPALILTLLAAVIARYFDVVSVVPYLLLACGISLVPRDVASLFIAHRISERLLHFANIILVMALVPLVALFNSAFDLSPLAPTSQGLVDNLWSSLTVAILVLLYFQMTNMSTRYQDQAAEEAALSNYVVKAYNHIYGKYDAIIQSSCIEYACSKQVLYAVLIYEDMNRPATLRRFENLIVRVFHFNLTVGIAQVRSDKPITDEDSIRSAAKILGGSVYADSGVGDGFGGIQQLEATLKDYNSSKLYSESVSQIISKLRIYAPILFRGLR